MPGDHPLTAAPPVPLAVGVDIVDVHRMRGLVARRGDAVLDRLFTPAERADLSGARGLRWDSLAGRFAAKEAVRKVFGSRGERASFTDIEIDHGPVGQPTLRLLGGAAATAHRCGFQRLLLSIAHERTAAVAVVVAV